MLQASRIQQCIEPLLSVTFVDYMWHIKNVHREVDEAGKRGSEENTTDLKEKETNEESFTRFVNLCPYLILITIW